ncbi:ty3-gypsy retrotransposon protein [Cucumis melo var. makuwa]|uniref:Ty3-gypsy retrotransposon protein n=1 Tax=Cucumis melo var. makuwa TaxID=1194695 RepID=A0A5D3DRM3_CUCMM|nr:ty3-gypsy retrotransposon protein [Cucumis melo var. makuwa]TYK26327.1 ty3-gypsy retrotransposon protein [Cucumis melo var. makuwa]
MDRTWMVVGVDDSLRVPSSGIPREEDQVGPCEQLDALSPFNLLSKMQQKKENPWMIPTIEVTPEDSQGKEQSTKEDDEGWIVVTRQKKRKLTLTQKESHFYKNYRRLNSVQRNKKKKKTRKPKLVHEENKDFSRPQCLITLADFFPTRFLCDHQDENPEVVVCHAINEMEEESIPPR